MKKLAFLIAFTAGVSTAGQAQTIDVQQLERFGLQQQVPGAAGYDIRARKFVVPDGAVIPEHGHADRAGIVYVLSGNITEFRGELKRELGPGDSLVEDADTVHRYVNNSGADCVLIAFDIPKSE